MLDLLALPVYVCPMTNTENTPSPESTNVPEVTFVDTVPSFTDDLTTVLTPYRYLAWLSSKASKAYHVDLTDYSPERQAAVAAFVDHGLVTERRRVVGEQDGRVTYRLTDAGRERLEAARAAADLVVVG